MSNIKHIIYLCDRLSPYHHVSLNQSASKVNITCVQFSTKDNVYSWDTVKSKSNFNIVTLFHDKPLIYYSYKLIRDRIESVLSDLNPDVVALSGWDSPASLFAFMFCIDRKIPTIMLSDSQYIDKKRSFLKEILKSRIVRLSSAGFVAGSPHILYLNKLGIPKNKIITGSSVVDNEYFTKGADAARQNEVELRERYSLPENYFLFSGRFILEKNIPTLLKAYSLYLKHKDTKSWNLVLLGDGCLYDELISIIDELDLKEKVLLPGFIQYPELPIYYGLANVFILPSISETWGLVVNEAAAAKLPLLVSKNCGCSSDLVIHNKNGFIFDPLDFHGLADYLIFLSNDKCLRNELGKKSHEIVQDWNVVTFENGLLKAAKIAMDSKMCRIKFMDKLFFWLVISIKRIQRG